VGGRNEPQVTGIGEQRLAVIILAFAGNFGAAGGPSGAVVAAYAPPGKTCPARD